MSLYRLFDMSVLQAKPQPGQTEGNFYVACTLENQDCVFEENTNIVMFGVDGLIRAIRPYLDAEHGGTAQTSNEDGIPDKYKTMHGIFVTQKLQHGMSYLLDNNGNPRLDKNTNQPITMDSVNVFCILINEQPKVDGTPNYAKNWDPISRVRSIERQFFRPVNNTPATQAGNAAPQPAPQPAPDPLAAAIAAPTQQPTQSNVAQPQQPAPQPAPQPNVAQPQPSAVAPGSTAPASFQSACIVASSWRYLACLNKCISLRSVISLGQPCLRLRKAGKHMKLQIEQIEQII